MDERKRICMIVQQRDVKGGIAAVVEGYYDSALEERYNIRFVESYCDGPKIKKLLKAIGAYIRYFWVLCSFKPDLVHVHSSFGPSFYRMQPFLYMAKRRNIPVVDHCHGADFDEFYTNAPDRKKKRIKKVFSDFSKVIVLSKKWQDKMALIVPKEHTEVIENYCRPVSKEHLRGRLDERFSAKKILFLGEIGKRKGGFDFARIVKETLERMPDAKFVFCGEGNAEDTRTIKEEIESLNPGAMESGLVRFPGWVRDKDKEKVLDEASVFILPSYNEGLPMSILDAMAYGLPIISTNVGGIPELVNKGQNGFLSDPGDASDMAGHIADILSDQGMYYKMSEESLNTAKERFGFDAHIKKLADVYESVMYSHPSRV